MIFYYLATVLVSSYRSNIFQNALSVMSEMHVKAYLIKVRLSLATVHGTAAAAI